MRGASQNCSNMPPRGGVHSGPINVLSQGNMQPDSENGTQQGVMQNQGMQFGPRGGMHVSQGNRPQDGMRTGSGSVMQRPRFPSGVDSGQANEGSSSHSMHHGTGSSMPSRLQSGSNNMPPMAGIRQQGSNRISLLGVPSSIQGNASMRHSILGDAPPRNQMAGLLHPPEMPTGFNPRFSQTASDIQQQQAGHNNRAFLPPGGDNIDSKQHFGSSSQHQSILGPVPEPVSHSTGPTSQSAFLSSSSVLQASVSSICAFDSSLQQPRLPPPSGYPPVANLASSSPSTAATGTPTSSNAFHQASNSTSMAPMSMRPVSIPPPGIGPPVGIPPPNMMPPFRMPPFGLMPPSGMPPPPGLLPNMGMPPPPTGLLSQRMPPTSSSLGTALPPPPFFNLPPPGMVSVNKKQP